MPGWLISFVLPYVAPIIIQGLTPILTEYVKKANLWLLSHLPQSTIVVVAGVLGEAINQAQAYLTAHPLPYGLSGLIAIWLNSFGNDFGKQPPTPGMR